MSVVPLESPHACCARCTSRLRYARMIADAMGLRDWTVQVGHEPPADASATATAQIPEGRRLVLLRFADAFELDEAWERRHATVHELCHPLVNGIYESVEGPARAEFGGAALRVFIGGVQREIERTVDVMASVIAPFMPLPD